MHLNKAVDFANEAAGVVVGKKGTATVTCEEIETLKEAIYGSGI
jgi:bifunctional ADP-heptose synthase (sugar kinase/adenylyltransferase)